MSESTENAALAEILRAIADRRIRRKVQKLLQLGEEAVRALGELDAALYVREGGEAQIEIVSDAVLSHFRRLLEYLRLAAAETPDAPENAAPAEPVVETPAGSRPRTWRQQLKRAAFHPPSRLVFDGKGRRRPGRMKQADGAVVVVG